MKKKKAKRMHTEDARFLRDLFLQVLERVIELEHAVGFIQYKTGLKNKVPDGQTAEVIES